MRSPLYTDSPWQETYSEIIDVRSEAEFAEDHLPNALNFPVLNNEERAKVGTIYKQISSFEARKIGAALVSQNISHHLHTHFLKQDKDYHPLIYCWRGGQRSESLGIILAQIGWRVTLLQGGYKIYRAYVREQLAQLPQQLSYKILCGLTGTGKTQILHSLQHLGAQVLDLEALAHHRGSLLGQEWYNSPEPQPAQKQFESNLLEQLQQFDPTRTVWIESESNKIGQIHIPAQLWAIMQRSPCVEIQCPLPQRVQWLLAQYPHLVEHRDFLKDKLQYLKSHYGRQKLQQWFDWIDNHHLPEFVADILVTHYDPAYHRSMSRSFYPRREQTIQMEDCSPTSLENTACLLSNSPEARNSGNLD